MAEADTPTMAQEGTALVRSIGYSSTRSHGLSIPPKHLYAPAVFIHAAKSRPPFHPPQEDLFAIRYEQEGDNLRTRRMGRFRRGMPSSEADMVRNEVCMWPAIRYMWPFQLGRQGGGRTG